jgi:peptide/nickel transport system permease protein
MARVVAQRIGYVLLIMWLASIAIFLGLRLAPGDVSSFVVNPATGSAQVAQLRRQLGLDQPLLVQYWHFISGILTLHFGTSAVQHRPVTTIIAQTAPHTLVLAGSAALLAYGIGIPLGVAAALYRNRIWDRLIAGFAVLGLGVPSFVLALVLVYLLGVKFRVLPVSGDQGFSSLILPAVVLSLEPMAGTIRLLRATVVEQLNEDYVRSLTAKGLRRHRIVWLHVLRNSLGPVVLLAGVQLRNLIGYALIIEVIFDWPGMGSQLVNAILERDYVLAQVMALLITFAVIILNFAADACYAALDPRSRPARRRYG